MLHYFLQVVAFQVVFLLIYDVFLRQETFFNLNRAYLLITALLSTLIPIIEIDFLRTKIANDIVQGLPEVIIGNSTEQYNGIHPEIAMQAGINLEPKPVPYLELIVITGMCLAALLLVLKAYFLIKLLLISSIQKEGKIRFVNLVNSDVAFSFFNYIFLGTQLQPKERTTIIAHELVHVRQKHSLDLLFFEGLKIVLWFNPLAYMYQKRISELHEYIVDSEIVKQQSKNQYYNDLLAQAFATQNLSFVNPFYRQSFIKKRILMLNQSKSNRVNIIKYLLLVPVIILMLMYSSCSIFKTTEDKSVMASETTDATMVEIPFGKVEQVPMYASCNHLETNESRKQCMVESIAMHINKNFNISIGDSLGLNGTQRINVLFKIDKNGNVTAVRARAPLPQLEEEAVRVITTLPKFTPGKHKGKAVIVPYSLPIVFEIPDDSTNQRSIAKNKPNENNLKKLKAKFKNTEEVPFLALDKAPLSIDCLDAKSEIDSKECFTAFITKFVNSQFNLDISSKLGLKGKQRINVLFKVDKNGSITGAKARAPHPELEVEALRVINSLPKFTPGEMNGRPVVVNYSLPILFEINHFSNDNKRN